MAGLEERLDAFEEAGVEVVALSAEDEEGARTMQDREDISFPILYGLDVHDMQDRLGLWIRDDEERTHLEPAQLVLDPRGRITLACYSSGSVGRLDAEEALEQARAAG